MQDDNNRKDITPDAGGEISDDLKDALLEADDVIAGALRRKELEEAIAETDREVEELAARRRSGVKTLPDSGRSADAPEEKPHREEPRKEEPHCAAAADSAAAADGAIAAGSAAAAVKRAPNKRGLTVRKLLFILLLAAAAVISIYLIRKYTPTSKRMSYEEYFGDMAENEAAIVLQDHNAAERALVSDTGSLYIPYELVRSSLNERFFWDETLHNVIFTTPLQTFEIPINASSYTVIDGALTSDPTSQGSWKEIVLLRDENTSSLYLSLDFIAEYTNITYSFEKDTRHVYIRNAWGDTMTAAASKDAAVRYRGGIKSPILTDLNKGDMVVVLDETPHWLRVLTADGFIGYVKSNRMTEPSEVNIINEGFMPQEYTSAAPDERVSVIWHIISTEDANRYLDSAVSAMTGMTAISPTWFSLSDNDGNVDSIASAAYVKQAHARGLQVWGLVSDFSSGMDTSVMLASTAARRNCVKQLIGFADELGMDGINVDLEYMEEADALCYTQFIRELSIACRKKGLILSVDLVPPYDFNAYLNRTEIAQVCDYLINMGYDEHYPGSEAAGSVASLPYEENSIRNLLAMGIPAKKLISAIPFYTRIWYTSSDESGNTYVNSEEISMNTVAATLDSWHLTPSWDAESAQNYVGWYTDEGVLCEIWIEDAQSLQRKALLTSKYDLGGTAIWALGFETDSVWETIADSMGKTPEEAAALEAQLIRDAAAAAPPETETESELS